jgi:organic hydroperoxide reductase OsmC/OhrA
VLHCSNEPLLGGDPSLYNPKDMLITALSSCHMLWYLHLASNNGINVLNCEDTPIATGETLANGASRFLEATLRPEIKLVPRADLYVADAL